MAAVAAVAAVSLVAAGSAAAAAGAAANDEVAGVARSSVLTLIVALDALASIRWLDTYVASDNAHLYRSALKYNDLEKPTTVRSLLLSLWVSMFNVSMSESDK